METRITLPFADGEYEFWLPMSRVVAAEREMGRLDADGVRKPHSILTVFHDLGTHLGVVLDGAHVLTGPMPVLPADAHAIIRNALVGGNRGMVNGEQIAVGDAMARNLIETYCYPARPLMHDLGLAWRILQAAVYGIDPGSKKKTDAPEAGENLTPS